MKNKMLSLLRQARVFWRILLGQELRVKCVSSNTLMWFGNPAYGGWKIPTEKIRGKIGLIDAGVGEDLSFSQAIIRKYKAHVIALDPTPRAAVFVKELGDPSIFFLNHGLAPENGKAKFYLPSNKNNVSGSLNSECHLKGGEIEVDLTSLSSAIKMLTGYETLILKIDIEGAEFDLIDSDDFHNCSTSIDVLCIEFHHRWPTFGVHALRKAVRQLEALGFKCVWYNRETNEEFTFVRSINGKIPQVHVH
uniref:FkbM family methyltransferase n=1 Tax=Flavobacterium sp. TaxID=239 RepID=UPI0040495B3C